MAAPFPPQGAQTQHTQRPLKIYAEQYLASAALPIGASTIGPTGEAVAPYVIAGGVYYVLHETDWVISSRYTGRPVEVISAEEYAERFGPSGVEVT